MMMHSAIAPTMLEINANDEGGETVICTSFVDMTTKTLIGFDERADIGCAVVRVDKEAILLVFNDVDAETNALLVVGVDAIVVDRRVAAVVRTVAVVVAIVVVTKSPYASNSPAATYCTLHAQLAADRAPIAMPAQPHTCSRKYRVRSLTCFSNH